VLHGKRVLRRLPGRVLRLVAPAARFAAHELGHDLAWA